jgi:rare lipoprotein A
MRAVLMVLACVIGTPRTAADEMSGAAATATPEAKAEAKRLDAQQAKPPPDAMIRIDPSGRKESGKATYYGPRTGRTRTASGKRLDAKAHVAASKTLPLGTTAKVTNLDTGKSDTVTIEDRGPFAKGRVVDVTPEVAKQIGLDKKAGVASVVVAPITVPQPDGSVKLGAGAAEPQNAPARRAGSAKPQQEAATAK